jgi:membrane-associated phospholipid phosphatase
MILKGASELMEHFTEFFWSIGYFGWQIATLYALYVCYHQDINYAILFFILFLLSGWLNHEVLKKWIYSLRPSNPTLFLASEVIRKTNNGMPSGHAQQTAFALTIAYLFTHQYLGASILLFLLTLTQRLVYKNHTLSQLLVGGIVGLLLGYTSFYVMRYVEKPMKKIEEEL